MVSIDQPQQLLQAAIALSQYGFRVFPLAPGTKIPLFKDWPWQELASNEPRFIKRWWEMCPTANIALVADEALTILDVDRKTGKPDGWAEVGAFIDQSTPWVATPNNGYHFYFQHISERLRSPPGVDIQTGHRYVVAPPSQLETGPYVWATPLGPPWDNGILPFPLALKNQLLDFSQNAEDPGDCPELIPNPPAMPLADLSTTHVAFLKGGMVQGFPSRSELLQSIATKLYKIGYTNEEVLSMLLENPFVHEAAYDPHHNNAQSDLRARKWLWSGLKKVAYHRRKRPDEWAIPVQAGEAQPTPKETDLEGLRDAASRLSPGEDIRPILRGLAALGGDAFEEDQILGVVHRVGYPKGMLTKLLAQYKNEIPKDHGPHAVAWKHTHGDNNKPAATVENLAALLESKQAIVRHNLMNHRIELTFPNMPPRGEEWLNVQLAQARSWAAEHQLPLDTVGEQLVMLAQQREYHPFREWIEATQWDGTNRLEKVLETIKVAPEKERMRNLLVTRWLVSIIASVWGYGNRPPRGVLTFTGRQHQGKTTWLYYLVPQGMYHQGLILRPDQRDSATKGLRYLLVEIGEIGTTFRKSDIESLKSYIGQRKDSYRLAYAKDESEWTRRTIFAASANNSELLHDQSGNTRWWVLETLGFDLDTMEAMWGENGQGYELQQFWHEMYLRYKNGEQWDLSEHELENLEKHLQDHEELSPLAVALMDTYVWQKTAPEKGYPFPKREMDIRNEIQWGRPFTPTEGRELRDLLKKMTGQGIARMRRVDLATKDGQKVASDWQAAHEGDHYGKTGRWWYLPALRGSVQDSEKPFKGA